MKHLITDGKILGDNASLVDIHSYMYRDNIGNDSDLKNLYDSIKTINEKNIQAALITEKTVGFKTVKDFLRSAITKEIKEKIQQLQIKNNF